MDYNTAGLLAKQTYGNGDYVDFTYDSFDRQTEKRYNGDNSQRVTYSYGNNGSVAQITDYFTNSNTRFTYDLAERVVSQREYSGTAKNGGTLLSYTNFTYADKTNYLTGIKHFSPLGTQTIGYTFGVQKDGEMPDQVYSVSWNGAEKVKYTYDKLGRLESKHTGSFDTNFTYEDVNIADENRTTTLVKSVTTPTGTYTYEYDKLGNILSVTDGTYTTSYEYDSLNQLVRVNDEKAGKTTTYSYTNGNITECNEYPVGDGVLDVPQTTKTWEYNDSTWGDLLTNFNGESITYDEIGNPLTIGEKSLTWTGRQLQSITDGDSEIAYTYNGDGLRTSKTVNGTKTEYYYNGSILAGQKSGDVTLVFMYDNNSDIFGFIYNDTEYYYIKNAQNDVIAIADADGNVLVKYFYDAWGKIILITDGNDNDITNLENDISHGIFDIATGENTPVLDENGSPVTEASTSVILARINPILYRSYYYDKETEWYYLKSRYYSPDMCRFINADGYIQTGQSLIDKNMFAYCLNNPVNYKDDNGNASSKAQEALEAAIFLYVLSETIKAHQAQKTQVYICKPGEETKAPPDSIIVHNNRKRGPKKGNNFEVVNSYRITDKITQQKVCQAIIDYNKNHPDDSGWNRDIDTMLVEWDWHNAFYDIHIKRSSSRSVNFDMGLGTNSTSIPVQITGYMIESALPYIKKTQEISPRGATPCIPF